MAKETKWYWYKQNLFCWIFEKIDHHPIKVVDGIHSPRFPRIQKWLAKDFPDSW